jgi:hypothetical protein
MHSWKNGTIIVLTVAVALVALVVVFGGYGVGIRWGGDLLEFRPAGAPPMLERGDELKAGDAKNGPAPPRGSSMQAG